MIIGQFCETYPPSLDGVGRVMLAYCETLHQMGHRSLYISTQNRAYAFESPHCETLLYGGVSIPGQNYRIGIPRLSRSFRRASKNLRFDVVHAHSPFLAGREALRLSKRTGAPLVATFHSKYYDDFYKATGSKLLAKLGLAYILHFYRLCDEVWTVNDKTAEVLCEYGYKGEIITMPNGTNPLHVTDAERTAALSRFPLRDHVPTLLFAGQLDFKKNVESVLRACAQLMREGMDFQLLMVGAGPNAASLQHLAKELGLAERTVFTGFIADRATLLSLFERSDLLVFPSLYDNAPMVVREAAAMGTPSLLIEGSCSAEGITTGQNGFLCQNTLGSIAGAIRDALPLCAAVGESAKATIPIPWDQIMVQVLARYQKLLDQKIRRVR